MDFAINLFFGLVGVGGLGFAVWQWKQSDAAKALVERTLEAMIVDAELYERICRSESGILFAGQIQRQCSALLSQPKSIGRYFVRFFPGEDASYWLTELGVSVIESGDRVPGGHKIALQGKAMRNGFSKLLFGPYETLPFKGTYRVEFHILVNMESLPLANDSILRLDVNGSETRLVERFISKEDIMEGYQWYSLTFRYRDLREKLEYRITLLPAGLEARVYDVVVRRIGN